MIERVRAHERGVDPAVEQVRHLRGQETASDALAAEPVDRGHPAAQEGQAFLAGIGVAGTRWLDVLDPRFDAFYLHGIHSNETATPVHSGR